MTETRKDRGKVTADRKLGTHQRFFERYTQTDGWTISDRNTAL